MSSGLSRKPAKTLFQHLRATLALGVPLVFTQIIYVLIGATDTLMLGWLGVAELAAGTLAFQLIFTALIIGMGFAAAITPLVATAVGREDHQSARRSTRMGLWVLLIAVFVLIMPLSYSEQILLALGQDPELAALADKYVAIAKWSLIPSFLISGLRNFLTSLERTNAIVIVAITMAVLNGVLNWALIFGNFGAPRLEMEGAAIATLISNLVALLMMGIYVHSSKATRPYALFQRFWRPEWQAFREVFKLGWPISLTIFSEAGMFSAASLMIGWIGTIPLAAHGIALQWASLAFMVPLGFAQAGSVRVGNAAGREDRQAIGSAAWTAVFVGLAFASIFALVFLVFPEPLIQIFLEDNSTDASAVLSYAIPLFAMAAAFQLFDALQVASGSNLRGLQDTKIPMIIATVSYWPIGMGTAYLLAFPLGFGGAGVWAGLVAGLAVAGIGLTWRFARRETLGLVPANIK